MNPEKTNMEYPFAEVTGLSHDGRGVASINQKTTFISGALPGELVSYQIKHKSAKFNDAIAINIVKTSPERVTPPCQHFSVCGGCSMQHLNMDAQIKYKQDILLEQLKHFGHAIPKMILPPLSANTLGYRRKARLGVKWVQKKNKVLVGFREKSSRYLADLELCKVLHPSIGERLNELSELIGSLQKPHCIPQIEVAVGDIDVAIIIRHLEPLSNDDIEKLIHFGKTFCMHIYAQPNQPDELKKLWPQDNNHRLTYSLRDENLLYSFHPLDFTQINLELNNLMVSHAIAQLELCAQDKVLDLFCGIGNFTLPIARRVNEVVGVEGSDEMVKRAENNAQQNGLNNVVFYSGNLAEPDFNAAWIKPYNKLLLDPPRLGAKEILPALNILKPERIVYVSCNPATLARDAGELIQQYGYCLAKVGMMNMFPHTAHIEAIAVFEKN